MSSDLNSFRFFAYIDIDHRNGDCNICDIAGCYKCEPGIPVVMKSTIIGAAQNIILRSNDSYLVNDVSNITINAYVLTIYVLTVYVYM